METRLKEIGARIESVIKDIGMTRAQLGEALGLKEGAIGRHIRGETDPGTIALVKISKIGGVSLDWLINGQQPSDHSIVPERQVPFNAPLNKELMREAIITIAMAEKELEIQLPPEKRADLALMIYDEYSAGEEVKPAKVIQLVRLAA